MKKLFFIPVILMLYICAFTQGVAINETNATPDATALLDISSHSKGVLIPRLHTAERTAIQSPAEALFVFDIDTHSFWFYTSNQWKEILKAGDNTFTLPYDGV